MAATSTPVRSEQTHFPITQKEARRAARLWFTGAPTQTIGLWRDTCRQAAIDGLPNADMRSQAFDDAFAREIGNLIIGGGGSHD